MFGRRVALEAVAGDEKDDEDAEDDKQQAHDVHENVLGVKVFVEIFAFFTAKHNGKTTSS